MIDGASDEFDEYEKLSHEHEEECLFFVALSRGRTRLSLHLPRRHRGGKNRSPSPFLENIPASLITEVGQPATLPLPAGMPTPTCVEWRRPLNWTVSDNQLAAYERCPRRFFYTHVLGLGGGRKPTAFTQTHACLHDLIAWLALTRRGGEPTFEQAVAAFEEIWQARGPTGHGFSAEYHQLALRLVATLVRSGAGRRFRDSEPLAIDFPSGRVLVEPSEMADLPNGAIMLRRVRTGSKRSTEYDGLEYTLYHIAGRAKYGAKVVVEALHLADDGTAEPVEITATKMKNRKERTATLLADIKVGAFPPSPDSVTCPRCPHFFLCAALPKGPLATD